MPTLILLRHGQSTWNLENRFTGSVDVDLSLRGEEEAHHAGLLLKNYVLDVAYTSVLKRSTRTLDIILKEMGQNIPIFTTSALNERNYGDLQGLDKTETERKYGAAQVLLWRRSYDIKPPHGESLEDTYNRAVPYFKTHVEGQLKDNKNCLIVAHGNSLRALMMYLDGYSPAEIADINIETGVPKIYEYGENLNLLNVSYLGAF